MGSKFQRWWLGACVVALLLASWMGGFSVAVTSVFIVLYLTGVTLIGPDDAPAKPAEVGAAEPVDVVAADPEWLKAHSSAKESSPEEKSAERVSVQVVTAAEITADAEVPDDTDVPADTDAPDDTDVPDYTEAVVVYESASPAEQEMLVVEDKTIADTTDSETIPVDDDDAVPYPDDFEDFDDERAGAEVEERSPA